MADAAEGDARDRIALLLSRSAAYAELREVGPARADADAARDLADAGGDERASVRATVAVAEAALRSGAPDEAEALLGEALARAEAAGDDEGKATALRVRGFAALGQIHHGIDVLGGGAPTVRLTRLLVADDSAGSVSAE